MTTNYQLGFSKERGFVLIATAYALLPNATSWEVGTFATGEAAMGEMMRLEKEDRECQDNDTSLDD